MHHFRMSLEQAPKLALKVTTTGVEHHGQRETELIHQLLLDAEQQPPVEIVPPEREKPRNGRQNPCTIPMMSELTTVSPLMPLRLSIQQTGDQDQHAAPRAAPRPRGAAARKAFPPPHAPGRAGRDFHDDPLQITRPTTSVAQATLSAFQAMQLEMLDRAFQVSRIAEIVGHPGIPEIRDDARSSCPQCGASRARKVISGLDDPIIEDHPLRRQSSPAPCDKNGPRILEIRQKLRRALRTMTERHDKEVVKEFVLRQRPEVSMCRANGRESGCGRMSHL